MSRLHPYVFVFIDRGSGVTPERFSSDRLSFAWRNLLSFSICCWISSPAVMLLNTAGHSGAETLHTRNCIRPVCGPVAHACNSDIVPSIFSWGLSTSDRGFYIPIESNPHTTGISTESNRSGLKLAFSSAISRHHCQECHFWALLLVVGGKGGRF